MTNQRLNEELIRKFGFGYLHDGRTNLLICNNCEREYVDLKDKLEKDVKQVLCDFFKSCGKEKVSGYKREPKNG